MCQHVYPDSWQSRLIFLFIAVDLLSENDVLEAQEQFLSRLPGGVKFSKSHFPEISMGAAKVDLLEGCKGQQPTMRACTSTRTFFPCKLTKRFF